jgi:hypothetical protein
MTGSIPASGNIQWNLKRRGASGKLRNCVFVIEKDTSIILAERCDPDTDELPPAAEGENGTTAHLRKFGIPYKVKNGPDGRPVLEVQPRNAPERTKRIMRFFDLTTPCDFPQCEELRRQWQMEQAQLSADCTDCEKGAVQRQYMHKLDALLPP